MAAIHVQPYMVFLLSLQIQSATKSSRFYLWNASQIHLHLAIATENVLRQTLVSPHQDNFQ